MDNPTKTIAGSIDREILDALIAAETVLARAPVLTTSWNGQRRPESTISALQKVSAARKRIENA